MEKSYVLINIASAFGVGASSRGRASRGPNQGGRAWRPCPCSNFFAPGPAARCAVLISSLSSFLPEGSSRQSYGHLCKLLALPAASSAGTDRKYSKIRARESEFFFCQIWQHLFFCWKSFGKFTDLRQLSRISRNSDNITVCENVDQR